MKDTKPRQLSSVPQAKEERVGVAYMSPGLLMTDNPPIRENRIDEGKQYDAPIAKRGGLPA
jgi:hypothetical protein